MRDAADQRGRHWPPSVSRYGSSTCSASPFSGASPAARSSASEMTFWIGRPPMDTSQARPLWWRLLPGGATGNGLLWRLSHSRCCSAIERWPL